MIKIKKNFYLIIIKRVSEPTEKLRYVKTIFKRYKNKTLDEINILTSSIVSLISKLSITKNKEEFSKYI